MIKVILSATCLALGLAPLCQAQDAPFRRGVNLTNWFQARDAEGIPFERYTRQDFANIRSLGADVIRLPISLHNMAGPAPEHTLDPRFLDMLDQAVDWAEELGLHLVLDNHSFSPVRDTDPAVREVLLKVWPQVARHFRDRSALVYYEVLNEPHGIDDAIWNAIQGEVIDAIRAVDRKHAIIVGGAGWNSYNNLAAIPDYADDNLIYTFHFYDPFLFSHQGASWTTPSMVEIQGIPFPYRPERMPELPDSLAGTWVGEAHARYAEDGNVAATHALLDIALAFRAQRGVPLFLGELGILMTHADPAERVAWYHAVREYLDEHRLAWTTWDYHGGFGLFLKNSAGRFPEDLNVPLLEALGFAMPGTPD